MLIVAEVYVRHKQELCACCVKRDSGQGVVNAICSRANRVLGFVSGHRIKSLMQAFCRTANSCRPGLIVGALRIACTGLCTAARFHDDEVRSVGLAAWHGATVCGSLLFNHLDSLWPGVTDWIGRSSIFTDLLFTIVVRSDKLCILVAGFLDAFVTAFNLQRIHKGIGLSFGDLMNGRVKMMTALCPAWAHTY